MEKFKAKIGKICKKYISHIQTTVTVVISLFSFDELFKMSLRTTVSKAFFRSIKTPHEYNPLSILFFLSLILTISRIACWVEKFSRKPYGDLSKMWCFSMKDESHLCMSLSNRRLNTESSEIGR